MKYFLSFISSILLLISIFAMLLRIVTLMRLKRLAYKIYGAKYRLSRRLSYLYGDAARLCSGDDTPTVILLFVKNRNLKYHFTEEGILELYLGNRETYRTSKSTVTVGKEVKWALKKRIDLELSNGSCVILFSKVPLDVTCSDSSAPKYLSNGDTAFGKVSFYSLGDFCARMID